MSNVKDKICFITDAGSGIGRAASLKLLETGAKVFAIGRTQAKLDSLRKDAGSDGLGVFRGDVRNEVDVQRAFAACVEQFGTVDVLLNNAGVTFLKHTATPDGFETTFAVNHLAYFLFTQLLLERVKESAPARIVNVASAAHKFSSMDFDNLNHEADFRWMKVYGQSKLANILFTYELARRLAGTGVTANCLHPGGVRTGLGANAAPRLHEIIMWLATPFLKTPEQGARTSVHLASAPELEAVTGRYFASCKEIASSPESRDESVAARLWRVSKEMTGLAAPTDS